MIDPVNQEGLACDRCGESAIYERIDHQPVAICDSCFQDQTDVCPECEQRFWMSAGYRIGSEMFCGDCGSKHPVVVGPVMAAIAADEMNTRRR